MVLDSPKSFLTRVVLENYKSIRTCDVRLGPLTFLVGANASGKSNFLDGLHFVTDALSTTLDNALRKRGGGGQIVYSPSLSQSPGSFGIRLEFVLPSGASGHYSVRIGARPDSQPAFAWEVLEEECVVETAPGAPRPKPLHVKSAGRGGNGSASRSSINDRLSLATVALTSEHPDFDHLRPVYDALSRMQFYQLHPRSVPDVVTHEWGEALRPDGSNVASVLVRLGLPGERGLDRINDYLRVIVPGLVKVRAEPIFHQLDEGLSIDSRKVSLLFEQVMPSKGVQLFWPSQMSDGTLRALGVLVALLQATARNGPLPPLVAIEEPEAQVHPAALGVFLDAMREASYCTQVVVTTHSPDLLDDKEIPTESILAVTWEGGATRIGPMDEASRSLLREHLFTAGELQRINQIAPAGGGAAELAAAGVRLFDGEESR
jgi:predicted ATPase